MEKNKIKKNDYIERATVCEPRREPSLTQIPMTAAP